MIVAEQKTIDAIRGMIQKARKIVITTHTNPDGDALGSSLAMQNYLILKGKQMNTVVPDPYADYLSWMKGADTICVFSESEGKATQLLNEADLIFCMDYNAIKRVDTMADTLRAAPAPRILIDHHLDPSDEFEQVLSTIHISSTSELVYHFIGWMGDQSLMNTDIASCIYAGIITDTGSFSYSCNYESTFLATANLIRLGINGEHIHRLVYNTYSESRLRLLGHCLSERLVVLPDYQTAYIYLTKEDLEDFNYQVGDTEDVVNFALTIKGIRIAALFTDRNGYIRISLRSKGDFSVNEFAREYFEGGGHRNAAGANSYLSLEETLKKFVNLLPSIREKLNQVS